MAALGLRDCERGQIGLAFDPIGELASGEALDPSLLATVEIDHAVAEMSEYGEVETSLEISTGDERPNRPDQATFTSLAGPSGV
jgi:hypothetical protein